MRLITNGIAARMKFQAANGIKDPLAAASSIRGQGNRIVLDGEGEGSYIENKLAKTRIPLKLEKAVYMMDMEVLELF